MQNILNRTSTCPQCRQICDQDQMKRIFIDFGSDEDLACIQTSENAQNLAADTDAEETIKLLLEHIDTLPKKTTKPNDDCEFCRSILEAFDDLQTEKEKLEQALNEKSKECANLIEQNKTVLKQIEGLQIKIEANEHNLLQLNERLDTSEQVTAAIQSENLMKDDIIRECDIERRSTNQKVHELSMQLNGTKIESIGLWRMLQTIGCKGIWPLKLLNMHHGCNSFKELHANERIHLKDLVPFCGDIYDWDFIIIPVIKHEKPKRHK